jgi:hypothetical protein
LQAKEVAMRGLRPIVLIGPSILLGSLLSHATTDFASSGNAEFRSAGSRQNTILESPCPANRFPPIQLAFTSVINNKPRHTTTGIRCTTEVRNQGVPVRGVPILLGGEMIDEGGNPVRTLRTRSGATNRAGQTTLIFRHINRLGDDLGARIEGLLEGEQEIDAVDTTCSIVQHTICIKSSTRACLLARRFKVEAFARTAAGPSPGLVTSNSKKRAQFSFFTPGSTDLSVQLAHRCSDNDHYWVFVSSSTSVPFDLTVTDTYHGEVRTYTNPGPFREVLDVAAFATCP